VQASSISSPNNYDGGIGTISEIFDGNEPAFYPKVVFHRHGASAWNIEYPEHWKRMDMPDQNNLGHVQESNPLDLWSARKKRRIDIRFTDTGFGAHSVFEKNGQIHIFSPNDTNVRSSQRTDFVPGGAMESEDKDLWPLLFGKPKKNPELKKRT